MPWCFYNGKSHGIRWVWFYIGHLRVWIKYTKLLDEKSFLGFMTCKTDDLKLDTNGKDFLKASLGMIKLAS